MRTCWYERFRQLLETAVKFSEEGETVRLAHKVVADSPAVIIESHGRTISTTALPKFSEIFSVEETLTPSGDLGLGPPVAYRILSLFGASVSADVVVDGHGAVGAEGVQLRPLAQSVVHCLGHRVFGQQLLLPALRGPDGVTSNHGYGGYFVCPPQCVPPQWLVRKSRTG
jgi:hypothetical protein